MKKKFNDFRKIMETLLVKIEIIHELLLLIMFEST